MQDHVVIADQEASPDFDNVELIAERDCAGFRAEQVRRHVNQELTLDEGPDRRQADRHEQQPKLP